MSIAAEVRRVARLLKDRNQKIVFVESCTGGLVSGALTRVPGISNYHCGALVVYRNETKRAYLGIPADLLEDPGSVSQIVAARMAQEGLTLTPEADLAAAVTGHLGPGAPKRQDGVVYFAVAHRGRDGRPITARTWRVRYPQGTSRLARQRRAVEDLLRRLAETLEKQPS